MKNVVEQYRIGQRNVAAMQATLGMLNVGEIDRLLTWYAAQAPARPSRRR